MSTCAACKYFYKDTNPACRRYPPYAHAIIVLRKSLAAGGMVPTEEQRSMFPNVRPDWTCGEWAPELALTS